MHERDIDRRTFVRSTGATAGALALAGCAGFGADDSDENGADDSTGDDELPTPAFPEVEDPPDAVYLPTHRESMRVLEPVEAGDYTLAPMLSYPHPFWLVTGSGGEDGVQRVDPEQSGGVHLMFVVWDEETNVVLPVDTGAEIAVSLDGERVGSPQSAWPMISQEMGFHFGDNVPLEEEGTYAIEVEIPPLSVRTTGDLEGRFTESATATFEFEYDREFMLEVTDGVEYLDEAEWGEPGALEPMAHGAHADDEHGDGDGDDGDHDHDGDGHGDEHDHGDHDHHAAIPYSALPPAEAYPGTHLEPVDDSNESSSRDDGGPEADDLPRSGDAAFVATLLESDSRLADGEDYYVLVSPRTPYNRVPLADMSLRAAVERDGETVTDDATLEQTIDGEYDLHYGTSLADVRSGDSVAIQIESPPQVARHQGYETAFLEMPPIELRVP
ncbi:DUF7350 domain-containing protein [Natronorubrum texcoconense]|uniref:DUF7350 domain-containing protein n=1 Tax=Natronorubrum texcoconense TaxID=1095776 RepID=A0A1G8ZU31_9EURY|nr:twin-arginine translocation signal domain-containing protein [Natronorubrum texcoconense]SDK17855.1 hypothetical protein SAMN04515672_2435 [Natronorubrum texcoconense]